MVFAQVLIGLLQRTVNIFLEILIHGCIRAGDACELFIEQHQFFFGNGIDDLLRFLAAFQEMRDDHVVLVMIEFAQEEFLEETEIVVVDVEIDHGIFAECAHEGVVDDLLVCAEFVEEEADPEFAAQAGIGDIISFAGHRADDADLLRCLYPFSAVSLEISVRIAELIDALGSISSFPILPASMAVSSSRCACRATPHRFGGALPPVQLAVHRRSDDRHPSSAPTADTHRPGCATTPTQA